MASLKIADMLYCYFWQGMGNNCNTYLFVNVLEGDHPHVIIDPGHISNEMREPCFEQLAASMGKDGISIRDIGLIINTHLHPDHYEASQALIEAGEKQPPLLAFSKAEDDFHRVIGERLYKMFGMSPPKLEPFFYLGEGKLELGKTSFYILHTPGHSPGSICIYWPENKVLITGDVVFYGSIGRTDFPGGNIAALEKSIEKLSTLDVEYLLPGHATEYGSFIQGKNMVERNFKAIKLIF